MSLVDTVASGVAEWRSSDGQLLLGQCRSCDEVHYYPRNICPFCFSSDVGRKSSSGRGRIYSHSHTLRGPDGPFTLAYVTLDEGVSLLTNIIEADPGSLAIDQPVELVFVQRGDVWTPYFRPVQ